MLLLLVCYEVDSKIAEN